MKSISSVSHDSHLESNESDINNISPGHHFLNHREDAKQDLDSCSSFVEDTLSNGQESDNGIEDDKNQYKLNVIATDNILSSNNCKIAKARTFLSSNQTRLPLRRGESVVERLRDRENLESASGKEMALNYLKRNNNSLNPFFRMNSMVTNANSSEDFKKELISCLNVPEYFKKKARTKAMIKRSQSLPKAMVKSSISEGTPSKSGKQVRFADTAGHGPLTRVCRGAKRGKKKAGARKSKAKKAEKTAKNSCACIIF